MDFISQLPDCLCLLSSILTTLSMKDLLKTSVLSRRWSKAWSLRRDLNFDIHNVLGTEKELLETGYLIDVPTNSTMDRCVELDLSRDAFVQQLRTVYLIDVSAFSPMDRCVDLDLSRDVFVKRVDQLVKHFQGSTKIDSFLLNFSLNSDQSSIIDQWLSFAIARGVGRIDLLLIGRPYAHHTTSRKRNKTSRRYKFDFGLFSESNASTLKRLSLQHCRISHPTSCDFIPLKNLRSLALEKVKVDEMFITSLLSNCQLLEELCLIFCDFKSSIPKIVSSSLCHLEVTHCCVISNIIIDHINLSSLDCLKLTSLKYHGGGLKTLYINTPMLKRIEHCIGFHEILEAFAIFATLPELEILHLGIHLRVTTSLKITQPLKYLKQLNLFVWWDDSQEFDLLWILAILQASPLLQKLSVMVMYPNLFENQKDIKDVELFSHDEVKVIELGGCVGNWYEIEFAVNVLKYAHKLERIVLSPYWREDDDSCDRNFDPVWFQNGRERISEKLQSEEVVGREKLVLI